jgi:hypothetical protein
MIEPTGTTASSSAECGTTRSLVVNVPVIVDRGGGAALVLLPGPEVRVGHRFNHGGVSFEIVGRRPHGKAWVAVAGGH